LIRRPGRGLAGSLLGAAAAVAVVTVLARIGGFARIVVFTSTVGYDAVGKVYETANRLPTAVYEIVAGGALAGLVVPLLSAAVSRGETEEVNRTTSALLTWAVSVLTPLAILGGLFAEPLYGLLADDRVHAAEIALGGRMLRIFAPQLVLYGVGIVLTGVLQAHRRFVGPALAPLLSSLTVIATYVVYAAVGGTGSSVGELSRRAELVLTVGTTLGVAALSLSLLVPLRGTGVRLRPTFRFAPGVAGRALRLGGAGLAAVGAQQVPILVVLRLSSGGVPVTTLVAYWVCYTVFLLPWAVFSLPVATSAFPRLSTACDNGDTDGYARTLATATRTVLMLASLAAAVLMAAAGPIADVLEAVAVPGTEVSEPLTYGIVSLAPGLLGYGLFALLTRALYARGRTGASTVVTVIGWFAVAVAQIWFAGFAHPDNRVFALAVGHSVGVTVLGIGLALLVAHDSGSRSLGDVGRTLITCVPASIWAAAAGYGMSLLVGDLFGGTVDGDTVGGSGLAAVTAQGILVGITVVVVFAGLLAVTDRSEAKRLLQRLRRRRAAGTADSVADSVANRIASDDEQPRAGRQAEEESTGD
jgi:putative peptidoglycan lipid II flippase